MVFSMVISAIISMIISAVSSSVFSPFWRLVHLNMVLTLFLNSQFTVVKIHTIELINSFLSTCYIRVLNKGFSSASAIFLNELHPYEVFNLLEMLL